MKTQPSRSLARDALGTAINWLLKIAFAAICIAGLGVAGYVAYAVLGPSWTSPRSGWPQVPPPELYVTTQPRMEDVAGVYRISQQNITKEGLNAFTGRECELNLRSDGTFSVTNYPYWSELPSEKPCIADFISTAGHWNLDGIHGSVYVHGRSEHMWSVIFSEGSKMDVLFLRKEGAPYKLMLVYGDGDDGTVMTFVKKRN